MLAGVLSQQKNKDLTKYIPEPLPASDINLYFCP